MTPAPRVVLLHGLWMPALSMTLLARRLRAAGFVPESLPWYPRGETVAAAAERLLARLGRPAPALFVGHSLGGRLALVLAARTGVPTRVVALGTPFAGSLAARRLGRSAPGRWLLGVAAGDVTAPWAGGVPPGCALGVVTGTRPLGLGRLVTGVGGPGDGTVRCDETRQPGCVDRLALPVTHTSMVVSRPVAAAAVGFLGEGKFPVNLHDS